MGSAGDEAQPSEGQRRGRYYMFRSLRTLRNTSVHQDGRQPSLRTQPRFFVTDIA